MIVQSTTRFHLLWSLSGVLILILGWTQVQNRFHTNSTESKKWDHGALRVSGDSRYLEHENGTPFLWIGDTAWQLFYRLTSEHPEGFDIEKYFQSRQEKGFTVIQAALLDVLDYKKGIGSAENGSMPFVDQDPTRREEEYWKWVDHVITRAEIYGLYLVVLPAWGSWVNDEAIFNTTNAYNYGQFLGKRYKNRPNIIWMLGGDRKVNKQQKAIWNSMAAGIREYIEDNHLMTFHPFGRHSSSSDFHNEDWLDFNTYHSGHSFNEPNAWLLAIRDWKLTPVKPTLNGEPAYEGIPEKFWINVGNPRMTDLDIRKDIYRSLFAGSFGVTYGHSSIWQILRSSDHPAAGANPEVLWYNAIDSPGSSQMQYAGNLLRSRPAVRWRDESLVIEGLGDGTQRMGATRGTDFALIYFPEYMTRTINLGKINGNKVRFFWYNTRSGEAISVGTFDNIDSISMTPPDSLDWVLVIDNVLTGFASPGSADLWYSTKNIHK